MTIHIVDEQPDIYLTREQYERLQYEYQQAFTHYSGPVPSFETWVRQRQVQPSISNGTASRREASRT